MRHVITSALALLVLAAGLPAQGQVERVVLMEKFTNTD
jgi:hypothetical protein